MTGTLFPILSFYGDIMDCRSVIMAECAGYEFTYMDYLNISASTWDKKIHHWAFTGNSLIIHNIKTSEKLCVSTGACWENIKPFGFEKKQKISDFYVWKEEGRELMEQDIDLVKKYYGWIKKSSLWLYQSYKFLMYFDCKDFNLFFWEPEPNPYSLCLEEIKKAFQILRIQERKEHD